MSNTKISETEQDLINNLEEYIECLKEIVEEFKKQINPGYMMREQVKYLSLFYNVKY